MTTESSERALTQFVGKFETKHQRLIRAARKILREKFPSAHELVYDNYNFFVIGYGPTERPSEAIFSIAASANGVGLCFINGAKLPDPEKILQGSGKQTRFVRLPTAQTLSSPAVNALFDCAVERAKVPFEKEGRGKLIIRSVAKKQRPRRKTSR